MGCPENSINRTRSFSQCVNNPLLRIRTEQVFSELSATISRPMLDLLATSRRAFFEKLQSEAGVSFEGKETGENCVIKGTFEHILLAKIKLEKHVTDLQAECLSSKFGANDNSSPDGGSGKSATQNNNTSIKLKKLPQRHQPDNVKQAKTSYVVLKQNANSPAKLKSRRKVGRPRKLAVTEEAEDKMGQTPTAPAMPSIPEIPAKIKQEPESDDPDDSPMAEICKYKGGPTLAQSLEAEAERKAAEWLSINLQTQHNVLDSASMDEPKDHMDEGQPFEYSCEVCSFKAYREGQFLKHVLIHGKQNTIHKCDKCDFASVSLNHYHRHKLSHSDSIFKCPQCSYQTDEAKQLARHVTLKHTMANNPPKRSSILQCNECPYNTTKIYHFERHLLVHNRDLKGLLQVYHCEQCPYRTHRKEHFLRHRDNVHLRHRPYQCNMCSRSYKRDDALQQHQVSVHNVYPQFSRLPERTISSLLDLALANGAVAQNDAALGVPGTSVSESCTTMSVPQRDRSITPGSPGTPSALAVPESCAPSPLSLSTAQTLMPVPAIH